mmetsp:Transcript_42699/g.68678  ORF Transcript_42699/g.68678 Transcript_42699/m.68678 type:complete len:328 (+) Transcript_42699:132-1115(+)
MERDDRKLALDAFAWALNIFASVAIVMVNKQLMGDAGFGFSFATTLCGLHFLFTATIGCCTNSRKVEDTTASGEKMRLPPQDLAIFVAVAACSIISLNLSLMLNTIGFYQVCKLAQIPTMCVLEGTFFGKKFSRKVIQAIVVVLTGVGVATVADVEMNTGGTVAAVVGVVATSAQQILVGHMQKKHAITSNFLLAKTSPYMAGSMLLLGPFMDNFVTGRWVTDFEWNVPSMVCLGVSCFFAVLVNISQYMCIGRFSAVSFQVIGHVKTCLVFFFGWIVFAAPITERNIMGCSLAVAGMMYYSHATTMASAAGTENTPAASTTGAAKV